MASFLIKRTITTKKIIKVIKNSSIYEFNPKNKSITKVNVTDPKIIEHILLIKYKNALEKLTKKVLFLIQSGDNDEETSGIMLNEINRYRNVLLNKYAKYLKENHVMYFLEQLRLLELELRGDSYNFNYHDEYVQEEIRNRRGK